MAQQLDEIRRLLREGRPVSIQNGEIVDGRRAQAPPSGGRNGGAQAPTEPVGASVQVKPHTWGRAAADGAGREKAGRAGR